MAVTENRKAPGVYVTEDPAFPASVAGVQTAVPIFVGYTESAIDPGTRAPADMQAVSIASLDEYTAWFGDGYNVKYAVAPANGGNIDFEAATDTNGAPAPFILANTETMQFNLFAALKLFYANGGGQCFVVSVGLYGKLELQALLDGVAAAGNSAGPTMLVVPDACLLASPEDYAALTQAQLKQAATLRDRMAILDLPGALDPASWTSGGLAAQRDAFYTAIAPAQASVGFGTAYAPALRVSVLGLNDIDYRNLQGTQAGSDLLKNLLLVEANALYGAGTSKGLQVISKINAAFPADIAKSGVPEDSVPALNQYLANTLPLFADIEQILLEKLNVAAPGGAMAGLWTANDANRGVWNAPANVSVAYAVAPEVQLSDVEQGNYTVPLNGNAINILRSFPNRGTVVWGARTLDGNSPDYRYIQVRRTLIYIEQSIKTALNQFVFAPNDAQTWATVITMVSDFLNGVWAQGGLLGDKASDAYSVNCAIGTTMTGNDVANGYMIVQISLQMIHPAEFIELTFKQQTQTG